MTSESYGDGASAALEAESDPVADFFGPPRTREEKALDRLRDLLSCDGRPVVWAGEPSPHGQMPWAENIAILAGVDPDGIGDADEGFLPLLPGVAAFHGFDAHPRDPAGRAQLVALVSEHVAKLHGLHLPTCHPHTAVKAVADAGLPIPWLDAARADPVCSSKLPRGLVPPKLGSQKTAQQLGGEATARGSNPHRDEQMEFARDLMRRNRNIKFIPLFGALESRFGSGLSESGWRGAFTDLRKELRQEREAARTRENATR